MAEVTYRIVADELVCQETEAADYVDVLNGIAHGCYKEDLFQQGNRNNVIVDMTVAAYMLGLDATDVLDKFIEHSIIDPCVDDEDTYDRVKTVLEYTKSFSWGWMIDPDSMVALAQYYAGEDNPVLFAI
jgi:hypothetical protein